MGRPPGVALAESELLHAAPWRSVVSDRLTSGDGRGTVYTYAVARRPTAPQWANEPPLVIAIVELEEGAHMTTNIIDCDPSAVRVGMAVAAVFDAVTPETTLVKFRPAT